MKLDLRVRETGLLVPGYAWNLFFSKDLLDVLRCHQCRESVKENDEVYCCAVCKQLTHVEHIKWKEACNHLLPECSMYRGIIKCDE
jgi:hypothetical protein